MFSLVNLKWVIYEPAAFVLLKFDSFDTWIHGNTRGNNLFSLECVEIAKLYFEVCYGGDDMYYLGRIEPHKEWSVYDGNPL